MQQPATFLHGQRTAWQTAPAAVRRWVLDRCGAPTAAPRDCQGGMATGVATVITGTDRAVFVKAVDEDVNPHGAAMYQREAELAALLPVDDRIPALLDAGRVATAGGGSWWVNLFRAHPGSPPRHPWSATDLDLVLTAWQQLSAKLTATPWSEPAGLSGSLVGWRRILADGTDPWHRLARLWAPREEATAALSDGGEAAVLGHIDLRADNILLDTGTGQVTFVDWAQPGTAAAWADVALLLADVVASGAAVESGGPIDVLDVFGRVHPGLDPELAVVTISSLDAFLHARAHREPVNPAMPHRIAWSAAASEQTLAFIEAHTR